MSEPDFAIIGPDDTGRYAVCGVSGHPMFSTPFYTVAETLHDNLVSAFERGRAAGAANKDAVYDERNRCVALVARMALALGWRAGVGEHEDVTGVEWDPEWRTIVFVDLPTGQASWHVHDSQRALFAGLPKYDGKWDGHTTAEKYERVAGAENHPEPATNSESRNRSETAQPGPLSEMQLRSIVECATADECAHVEDIRALDAEVRRLRARYDRVVEVQNEIAKERDEARAALGEAMDILSSGELGHSRVVGCDCVACVFIAKHG